jgi:hypothetical protein
LITTTKFYGTSQEGKKVKGLQEDLHQQAAEGVVAARTTKIQSLRPTIAMKTGTAFIQKKTGTRGCWYETHVDSSVTVDQKLA